MALIGNRSVIDKSPGRFLSGTAVSGDRNSFSKHGMIRNSYQALSPVAAIPYGANAPVSWVLPKTAGGMSSCNEAVIAVTSTANGVMGLPATGSTTFTVYFADAAGQLISSGTGSSTFAVITNNPLLTASLNGSGDATFTILTNVPILGAEASLEAGTSFSVSSIASILPLNDASPLRDALASFSFSGTLTPYAIGHMIGSALPYTELSPQSLAAAVWDELLSKHVAPGSVGEALFGAGGGTTPTSIWQYGVEGSYTAEELLRIIAAALAGKVSGADSSTITFRDLNDVEDRITATVDGDGNRTEVTVTP